MRRPFTAPRLLLGGESLLGVSRAPRDRMLAITARYNDAETLAVSLSKAMAAGAEGVLVSPSQPLRAALAELKQSLPIFALLPNVPEYVRDSSDLGLVGAALKRVRRASPLTLAHLGVTGLSHALAVMRSDFTGMVPLLMELEAAALGARDLRAVVLAAPLTDLALAGRHRAFFEHYGTFVRSRFGAAAGFETHNLGHLLGRLREWGITPDLIVGPINPRGLLMKPSPDELLAALRASKVPVLAKEVRAAGTVPLIEGARFALDHGAHGIVADLVDLEDLTAELRALKA
ncbi:MAG: hypothetical protein ACRENJ_02785 [Candidatus Eiseniibacteriota bacterium]